MTGGPAPLKGALPAEAAAFLDRPDLPGMWGALMDECARAAADLCRVAEALPPAVWRAQRPSTDPDTASPQALCAHVVSAARRYADYIRKASGQPYEERFVLATSALEDPRALRGLLASALRYTEQALHPLRDWPEERVAALKFPVRWGPTYDPEMILEHAVCHLLRHRRQLQRW